MIDWTQVSILREEVGAENFDEIVELFLEEADEVIARLRGAPRYETLEADLHALKGSAMNMEFNYFAGMCQRGETLAAAGRATEVDVSTILQGFLESKQDFVTGPPKPATATGE